MSILSVQAVAKHYAERVVFHDVTFRMAQGDRVGLVGPNASGKSTLLRAIASEEIDAGRIARRRGLRVGLLEQELAASDETIEAIVARSRARLDAMESEMRALEGRLTDAEALARFGDVQAAFEHAGGYDFPGEVERVLGGLGMDDASRDRPLASLSGGERARVSLSRLLLEDPDLLLLDEPTNHLDLAALEWLEKYLRERERSYLVVSHDRYFLDRVTTRTLALEGGTLRSYRGAYTAYARERARESLESERRASRQSREIARQQAFIERERAGQRARQARGRAKQLTRLQPVEPPERRASMHWRPQTLPLGSELVLETTPLSVGYDAPLLRTPALRVQRGSRVAIVGPNGTGKTTLLRSLLGEVATLEGHVRAAPGARVAALAQSGSVAPPAGSVLDTLRAVTALDEQEARDLLARFLFRGEEVFREVRTLSGGERARLGLALVAARPANVLALDEPTNHLDLDAREALEAVLSDYEGTVILVSHDRYFIDRLATHTWAISDGRVRTFERGYSAMRSKIEEEKARSDGRPGPPPAAGSGRRRREPPREVRDTPTARGGGPAEASRDRRPVKRGRGRTDAQLHELEQRIGELERRLEALARRVAEVAQAGNFMESRRAGEEYRELERALRELYQQWAEAER